MAGAQAIGLWTRAAPAVADRSESELYLTQPVLMGTLTAPGGHFGLRATVDLEGWTMMGGELNAGAWGEGYIDRRHPHTFLHEAIATARGALAGFDVSLSAGRGFAPFGTDDPMVRPFVKYPTNHHQAQILERLTATAALRRGPVILEAGIFNGDEPVSPSSLGSIDRFGDSWSARATVLPIAGLEVQASHASVQSPEVPGGGGLDQRKWSVSGRYEIEPDVAAVDRLYAFLEWTRSADVRLGRERFVFHSLLGEAAASRGDGLLALRVERATRPEEERLPDPFRSPRPAPDANILGITRWVIATAHAELLLHRDPVALAPFIEISTQSVHEIAGGIFDPEAFYGSDRLWSFSIGARLALGMHHDRMGRYGAALPERIHEGMRMP